MAPVARLAGPPGKVMPHAGPMRSSGETPEPWPMDGAGVIWRWKWVIALGTLCALIGAGLVTWNAPRSYRARAVLHTGDLSDEYAKDVGRLLARVNTEASRSRQPGELRGNAEPSFPRQPGDPGSPAGPQLSAELRSASIIEVALTTPAPDEAVVEVQRAVDRLLAELTRLMNIQRERQMAIKRRADELRTSLERLRKAQAAALPRSDEPDGALIFSRLTDAMVVSESRLAELERSLQLQEGRDAAPRLVVPVEVSRLSIRRLLAVNLAVSFVVGLAVSLGLAFALQYIPDVRRRVSNG